MDKSKTTNLIVPDLQPAERGVLLGFLDANLDEVKKQMALGPISIQMPSGKIIFFYAYESVLDGLAELRQAEIPEQP